MASNLAHARASHGTATPSASRTAPRLSIVEGAAPRVVHSLPGRVRLHLATWNGERASELEERLRRCRGVLSAEATPLTRNVLVRFDPRQTTLESVRITAGRLASGSAPSGSARRRGQPIRVATSEAAVAASPPGPGPRRAVPARSGTAFVALLPHLPKLITLLLSLLSASGPLGLLVTGVEALQLIAEIQAGWPA